MLSFKPVNSQSIVTKAASLWMLLKAYHRKYLMADSIWGKTAWYSSPHAGFIGLKMDLKRQQSARQTLVLGFDFERCANPSPFCCRSNKFLAGGSDFSYGVSIITIIAGIDVLISFQR